MLNRVNLFNKSKNNSKLCTPKNSSMSDNNLNHIYSHPDIYCAIEYIKNKLFFAVLHEGTSEPKNASNIDFFSIDNELIYRNFYDDFGPLNLGCLYRYCWIVNKKLKHPNNRHKQIVHYTIKNENKKANAAYLIASYAVLYLNKSPKDACKPLIEGNLILKPFRDAVIGYSNYTIRLQDCLNALLKAVTYHLFNFDDFNLTEYEKYEKLENGDLNWIVPQKFLAFTGPSAASYAYHPPEQYFEYFLNNKIAAVIRLNRECYDASKFTNIGICHYDMYLPDGSVPSRNILNHFIQLCESINGPIAVHCKAGLGRTGSLICAYLIKHYQMTAREAIAWTRICRPGSVIGHQQAWLENIQKELWHAGQQYRFKHCGDINMITHHKRGIYSIVQRLHNTNNPPQLSIKDDYIEAETEDIESVISSKSKTLRSSDDQSSSHEEQSRHLNTQNLINKLKNTDMNDDELRIIEASNSSYFSQGNDLNEIKMRRGASMKQTMDKYNLYARR